MKRRAFLLLSGATAFLPPDLQAQPSAIPVIGFLNSGSPEAFSAYVAALREGLRETGYVEGRNVVIDFRWARGRYEMLPAMARELVEQRVALIIATGGDPSAKAATSATASIPIVFGAGDDVMKSGLVESLNRPGRNATGISLLAAELEAKRLELLSELVPQAKKIAVLVNPDLAYAERQARAVQDAARLRGQQVLVARARSEDEFDGVFGQFSAESVDALIVASDPFFNSRRDKIIALANRARLPAIYEWREFCVAGGLISYGASLTAAYRQFGIYAGRILSGTRAGDLPVLQPTQFELVVNGTTARELGIVLPPTIVARADEVIE
ncbi:MAG TPA: ABC transporter substrate-binding protein [Alphaproteobacteria bacterium]|nr:ABC transporter substrate-binding protein [Alphaproteobacteria bacterium]